MRTLLVFLILSFTPYCLADINPDKSTVLITGGNRGIGLEFVNQYSARGWNVIATARKPEKADDLQDLAQERNNITIEKLDVTDHAAIDALAAKYKEQPIDILLNNAAITPKYLSAFKGLDGVDFNMAKRSMEVNAIGPLKMAQAFMPNVEASKEKKILVISSKAGSMAVSPDHEFMYSYRASKTALNMYMYTLSFETKRKGVIVTLLSPGTVNTMGLLGKFVPQNISTEESVTNLLAVIDTLTIEDNGKMLNHEDRAVIPW